MKITRQLTVRCLSSCLSCLPSKQSLFLAIILKVSSLTHINFMQLILQHNLEMQFSILFFVFTIIQVLTNWLFFNDNLKVAITRPRIHSQLFPPTVLYEKSLPPEIVKELRTKFGHVSITDDTYDVSGKTIQRIFFFLSVLLHTWWSKTVSLVTF